MSEAQKFTYLTLLVAVGYFSGSVSLVAVVRDPKAVILHVGLLLTYIFGLGACYIVNRRGDNREFVERAIVLGAPISLRMLLIVYGGWYGFLAFIGPDELIRTPTAARVLVPIALQLVAYLAGFLWLRRGIQIASSGPNRTSAVIRSAGHSLRPPTV